MENEADREFEGEKIPNILLKVSHEAKLKELLRNITSFELNLCSDASKEFIKLLKGDTGGELLREYVQTSSKCAELLQAWKLRQGKPGLSYVLSLISGILSHPDGKYKAHNTGDIAISRALDKFAHLIVEEKLGDVYKELNSKEAKCQNAALLLLASVVRRGSGLASDVAKNFDFKLPIFPKLAEYKKKQFESKRKYSTRQSFVDFAMSFLEMGKPGLLRWIIQQKEMFSGILRGLGSDDDETIVYILSTLRDRVLTPESLVPPGLRSVLFGSVTLEQLLGISGRESGGFAAEISHKVLYMVCTDPSNGLMPDMKRQHNPLRGNTKRLLDLMKKLNATEIEHHRDLLLAIVNGRPSFGSAYLDEFPYNVEDHSSPTWFAAVSLAANLVSSVGAGFPFGFLDSQPQEPPSINSSDVQSIITCIGPRPFNRLIINKGLLHSDSLVKHGTLLLVVEELKLLDSFISALKKCSDSSNQMMHTWASLMQDILNKVRIMLPDPQVLLSLLSSLNSCYSSQQTCLKRAADSGIVLEQTMKSNKKAKTCIVNEETDILVSGVNYSPDIVLPEDSEGVLGTDNVDDFDNRDDRVKIIAEIWGLHQSDFSSRGLEDEETYFYSKLLDTLKLYHKTMPTVLEGSFDFLKVLPSNAPELPTILQQSLLSLLIEHIGWYTTRKIPPLMYRHLHQFIKLLMCSPVREIKDQAYVLAQAAMLSTGAFDSNLNEIGAWFCFLPGYKRDSLLTVDEGDGIFIEDQGFQMFQKLSSVVVSFLCDAVSTIGNNLFKYWDLLRFHIHHLKGNKDVSPDFSPLVICVLEKCVRLLSSESGTFTLPEKTLISLYVSSTLRYLLETQVEAGLLSSLISLLLSGRLGDHCSVVDISWDLCEWRPLKNLLLLLKSIMDQQGHSFSSNDREVECADSSFVNTLNAVQCFLRNGQDDGLAGITTAFSFSILCTTPAEILQNFPLVISISQKLLGVPLSLLFSVFFVEPIPLNDILKLWPEMFQTGLEMAVAMIHGKGEKEEISVNIDMDSIGSASVAFCSFLRRAPFYVLFPAMVSINCSSLSGHPKLQDLLLAKLSEGTTDHIISSLRLVLFWLHKIQSSYRARPLAELKPLLELCFILIEEMLTQIFVGKPGSGCSTVTWAPSYAQYVQEVAEIVFHHPVVTSSLEFPLSGSEKLSDKIFKESAEKFLGLARQGVHEIDYYALNILATTSDHLFACRISQNSANKRILNAFKSLVQKLFLIFKNRFDRCIIAKDVLPLIPMIVALHTLIRLISPFELLQLADWLFSRIDLNDSTVLASLKNSALSVGLCIAGRAFDCLHAKPTPFNIWEIEQKSFDITLFERIYFHLVAIASGFELDVADLCLLKAVNVTNTHKVSQSQCLVISRVIASTPITILSHCICRTSKTKAQLLLRLTEVSPVHLSVFGHLLPDLMNKKSLLHKGNVNYTISDDDFIMLLPTALSYLSSAFLKYGKRFCEHLRNIPSFYWKILSRGFSKWNSYVSRDIFQVESVDTSPSSLEELLKFIHSSLLGQSVLMLQCCFDSVKPKKRLKLFDSICPSSGSDDYDLLDCDFSEIDAYSFNQSLNLVTKSFAKIYFCRMLLLHPIPPLLEEGGGDTKEFRSEVGSRKEHLSRIRFVNILVRTWQLIVKKFPLNSDDSRKVEGTNGSLFRFLEVFILRNIFELTAKVHNCQLKPVSLSYIEQLARSCLLYRFEDPETLVMLRGLLTSISEGESLHVIVLQLLIAHSQFAPTIQFAASKSPGDSQFGMIFRPMSSILRSLVLDFTNQNAFNKVNNLQTSDRYVKQLEVVKLLRILFHSKARDCGFDCEKDMGINSRELLFLLLSSYGATLSEIDLEIYNLMQEIESSSGNIVEMDYLWGIAAMKIRKEREQEEDVASGNTNLAELVEERRRSQFRENLPIDPKFCANTVLCFPYDRTTSGGTLSLSKLQQGIVEHTPAAHSANIERKQIYDPVYILRFSIHSLSVGYIEPLEFASLGLLAIAFVSISSPDVEMRKLGYEALGKFRNALEKCQKRKDVMRLRLLLTYLQNGIEEPWQRIPSISAMFVSESSFLLLDPSHDHYVTISKLLVRSPKVNMKSIPLFNNFFWSSSVNFKTERLWILRLLYSGLNFDDDAQIYIRNSVLETLLSFYTSPLSDIESKQLILQIVKKCVKLHKISRYLVEQCGLISWLSLIVSFFSERQYQDQRSFSSTHLTVALEVVHDVISSRQTTEWLQKYALEQLTELSSHLYMFLTAQIKLVEDVHLISTILKILTSTLKISQKRKVYQPHFTISVEGLFQIYQAVDVCSDGRYSPSAELGLKAVLMSTPPASLFCMDQGKLMKLVVWAISIALQSNSTKALRPKNSYDLPTVFLEEEQSEDSLISKLLRWLSASVILGRVPRKSKYMESNCLLERSSLETLQSFLDHNERGHGESGCEEILVAAIFHLQQLLGSNCRVLSSVVSALCLLLSSDPSLAEANLGNRSPLGSLLCRIRSPAEANPAWRWSFYQPWKNLSFEHSDAEKMDEIQACQSLLVAISNILGKKSLHSQYLSYQEVESIGVYKWERSLLEAE